MGSTESAWSTQVSLTGLNIFRVLFAESIRTLDLQQIEQIVQKEIQDLQKGQSPIIKVLESITNREAILAQLSQTNSPGVHDKNLDELQS